MEIIPHPFLTYPVLEQEFSPQISWESGLSPSITSQAFSLTSLPKPQLLSSVQRAFLPTPAQPLRLYDQ